MYLQNIPTYKHLRPTGYIIYLCPILHSPRPPYSKFLTTDHTFYFTKKHRNNNKIVQVAVKVSAVMSQCL